MSTDNFPGDQALGNDLGFLSRFHSDRQVQSY